MNGKNPFAFPYRVLWKGEFSEFIFFFVTAIPHTSLMLTSEGRLKSPAIDFDHKNPSIGGDFNCPSDMKTNAQILFCPYTYMELLFYHYNKKNLANQRLTRFILLKY
jgi:hypothetical protein